MSFPIAKFQRTACPICGSVDNIVFMKRRQGAVTVRYHWCSCSSKSRTEAAFVSHDCSLLPVEPPVKRPRRKAKILRK